MNHTDRQTIRILFSAVVALLLLGVSLFVATEHGFAGSGAPDLVWGRTIWALFSVGAFTLMYRTKTKILDIPGLILILIGPVTVMTIGIYGLLVKLKI